MYLNSWVWHSPLQRWAASLLLYILHPSDGIPSPFPRPTSSQSVWVPGTGNGHLEQEHLTSIGSWKWKGHQLQFCFKVIWGNYMNSPSWIKAIKGDDFPVKTMISRVRSQRGRSTIWSWFHPKLGATVEFLGHIGHHVVTAYPPGWHFHRQKRLGHLWLNSRSFLGLNMCKRWWILKSNLNLLDCSLPSHSLQIHKIVYTPQHD